MKHLFLPNIQKLSIPDVEATLNKSGRIFIFICGMLLFFAMLHSTAHAQVLYDPSSGSYFELYRVKKGETRHTGWHDVRGVAEKRFHNGIRGQLATIKTRETHEFIKQNFQIDKATWIGLRYMCSNRSLVWVTGEKLKRGSDFEAWHRQWMRSESGNCGTKGIYYMPVYYMPELGRLSWQATGTGKGFAHILVEYPSQQ